MTMSLSWNALKAGLSRRDLITRGLLAAGGLLLAKTSTTSAEAQAATAPRVRRAADGRPTPAVWRTRVRIIEKDTSPASTDSVSVNR